MSNETEDPDPLKRFILRIAIPFAVVAIIIAIIQFVLSFWFNLENVRPSPTGEDEAAAAVSSSAALQPASV